VQVLDPLLGIAAPHLGHPLWDILQAMGGGDWFGCLVVLGLVLGLMLVFCAGYAVRVRKLLMLLSARWRLTVAPPADRPPPFLALVQWACRWLHRFWIWTVFGGASERYHWFIRQSQSRTCVFKPQPV